MRLKIISPEFRTAAIETYEECSWPERWRSTDGNSGSRNEFVCIANLADVFHRIFQFENLKSPASSLTYGVKFRPVDIIGALNKCAALNSLPSTVRLSSPERLQSNSWAIVQTPLTKRGINAEVQRQRYCLEILWGYPYSDILTVISVQQLNIKSNNFLKKFTIV